MLSIYSKMDEFLLFEAIKNNNLRVVEFYVSRGADFRINNDRAVGIASAYGFLDIVKYLVSIGADIRAENDFAIRHASANGHLETVKYLVSLCANFRARDNYAVVNASMQGHREIVRYLVLLGADVNVLHIGQINMLVISSYNSGDFDFAIKLSKHSDFANDTIKKSLTKIQENREFFARCLSKSKYANICVVTHN